MPVFDRSAAIVGVGMKMYLGYAESVRYLTQLAAAAPRLESVRLFVLPSFPVLPKARELLAGSGVVYGAQDTHWEDSGPHTGSVSPTMLAELGCTLVEVGHAERRRDHGEDDAMTARKAAAAARAGLVPVVCVGELDRPGAGAAVVDQVRPVLDALPGSEAVIAYEPVWAIGADRPADPDHVGQVVTAIREAATGYGGPLSVVYGGSVQAEEIPAILAAGVDGVFASRSALTRPGLERIAYAAAASSSVAVSRSVASRLK